MVKMVDLQELFRLGYNEKRTRTAQIWVLNIILKIMTNVETSIPMPNAFQCLYSQGH